MRKKDSHSLTGCEIFSQNGTHTHTHVDFSSCKPGFNLLVARLESHHIGVWMSGHFYHRWLCWYILQSSPEKAMAVLAQQCCVVGPKGWCGEREKEGMAYAGFAWEVGTRLCILKSSNYWARCLGGKKELSIKSWRAGDGEYGTVVCISYNTRTKCHILMGWCL